MFRVCHVIWPHVILVFWVSLSQQSCFLKMLKKYGRFFGEIRLRCSCRDSTINLRDLLILEQNWLQLLENFFLRIVGSTETIVWKIVSRFDHGDHHLIRNTLTSVVARKRLQHISPHLKKSLVSIRSFIVDLIAIYSHFLMKTHDFVEHQSVYLHCTWLYWEYTFT